MALMSIKVFRAYDTTSNGFAGFCVPDMFRPLQPIVKIEVTKLQEAIDKMVEIANEYAKNHPNESFMPSLSLVAGRAPNGFKKLETGSGSVFAQWLKPQPQK